MIQDVINNITTAELEAEEIIRLATAKAKDVRLNAEVEAERIQKAAAKDSRDAVKLMQSNAEVVAVKKTEMRLREGNKEAEAYIAECEKRTDGAVDFIVGRFVEDLAIVSMKKLTLVAYGKDKTKVLRCLHKLGCFEVSRSEELNNTYHKEESNGKEEVGSKLNRLSFAFSFLKAEKRLADAKVKAETFTYDAPKKQLFNPTPRFEYDEFNKIIEREEELFSEIAELEAINQRYVDIKAETVKLQTLVEQVRIYAPVAAKLNVFRDTKNTSIILGCVPENKADGIAKIKADYDKLYVEEITGEGIKFVPVVIIALKEQREEILARFNELDFIRSSFNYDMTATEKVAEAEARIAELSAETLVLLAKSLTKLSVLPDLKQLFDYYSIENAKLSANDGFAYTRTTFVLEGWLPAKEEERVTSALKEISEAMVIETREPIEGDAVPTLTINNKIISPYESITNMYSPPNALTDIDPNPFVAFFYFILFGMMMGDAVYGIILALGGFLCYHFMKPVPGKGKLLLIIGMGGVSTFIWGALFGGWMSLPIENTFLQKLVWFNPIDESGALMMLIVSLAIGVIQIMFSMCLKMYIQIKAHQWIDAICDQGTWLMALIGLGLFAGAPLLGAPAFLKTIGLVLALLGVGIMVIFGGRKKKGFGKVTGGLGQLYGGVNIMSDVLSYSRLFGLGLATGVIGMVVNNICSVIIGMLPAFWGVPVLGVIVAAPIFIIGHGFNIGINTLGTYIHNSRLQFIEFFSRFYEGGGHTFKPLGSNTKYTYIEK